MQFVQHHFQYQFALECIQTVWHKVFIEIIVRFKLFYITYIRDVVFALNIYFLMNENTLCTFGSLWYKLFIETNVRFKLFYITCIGNLFFVFKIYFLIFTFKAIGPIGDFPGFIKHFTSIHRSSCPLGIFLAKRKCRIHVKYWLDTPVLEIEQQVREISRHTVVHRPKQAQLSFHSTIVLQSHFVSFLVTSRYPNYLSFILALPLGKRLLFLLMT